MAKPIHSRDIRKKFIVELIKKKSGAIKVTSVAIAANGWFFGAAMKKDNEKGYHRIGWVDISPDQLFSEFGQKWLDAVRDYQFILEK